MGLGKVGFRQSGFRRSGIIESGFRRSGFRRSGRIPNQMVRPLIGDSQLVILKGCQAL